MSQIRKDGPREPFYYSSLLSAQDHEGTMQGHSNSEPRGLNPCLVPSYPWIPKVDVSPGAHWADLNASQRQMCVSHEYPSLAILGPCADILY